jgi:hypothetical protein
MTKPPAKPRQKVTVENPDALFGRIVSILDQARSNVVRAVNSNMVLAYGLIGREIVEALQGGEKRAAYGQKVVEDLSRRLTERYGQGFSERNLQWFKQFYLTYKERFVILHPLGAEFEAAKKPHPAGAKLVSKQEISSPVGTFNHGFSPQLSWSHYRALAKVDNTEARDFYEREAVAGTWDKRTLERQIQSFYYGLFTAPDDNPTIGLILCTEKNETVARYSVFSDRKQICVFLRPHRSQNGIGRDIA